MLSSFQVVAVGREASKDLAKRVECGGGKAKDGRERVQAVLYVSNELDFGNPTLQEKQQNTHTNTHTYTTYKPRSLARSVSVCLSYYARAAASVLVNVSRHNPVSRFLGTLDLPVTVHELRQWTEAFRTARAARDKLTTTAGNTASDGWRA